MSRHRVCLLAYQGLCLFEFASALDVLGSDRSALFGDRWYTLGVCSLEAGPLRTDGGLAIDAFTTVRKLPAADTVIVPGWRMGPVPGSLCEALRAAHAGGARIASICTGAFVLAAAGLLDGRRATTHWRHAAQLADEYPEVDVDPGVLYVDEGDVVTSAGSAAGIDMLLHLVRHDYGAAACNAVARTLVVPPHRDGGQAQYIERAVPKTHGAGLNRVIEHLRRHPEAGHSIDRLAGMAAMSPRTFHRRFKAATGQSPYDWLIHERVRLARDLLETTSLPVDRVAYEAGFGAPDTFRHHFRRIVGTAPAEFRRSFHRSAAA